MALADTPQKRSLDNIRIIEASDLQTINKHKDDWNNLAQKTPPYFPSCSHAYIAAFFEHFTHSNDSWVVYFAYENETLMGVLPLIVARRKTLRLKWQELRTPFNSDVLGVSPLLYVGYETEVVNALLLAAWSGKSNVRHIELVDSSSRATLLKHSQKHTYLQLSSRIGRFITVNSPQDEYQSSLSGNFRSNQRKAANKLSKLSDVKFEYLTNSDFETDYLSEFMRVEELSWKGRDGTAIQCSEKMSAFYRTLTKHLAQAGWLEWQILRTEGRAIAVNLAIRFHRSIIIKKLGYDEAYSSCSPGGMLLQNLLDRAFSDNAIDNVDIITDAKWYDNWKMDKREYVQIRFYNRYSIFSMLLGYIPDRLFIVARRSKILKIIVRTLRKVSAKSL